MRAAKSSGEAGLLRHVAVETQPRMLVMPLRPGPNPGVAAAVPRPGATPAAPLPSPEPVPASAYEDARARGLRDGHAAGLQQGLEEAQRRIDEATRAAQAAAEAQARRAAEDQAAQWEQRRRRLDDVLESMGPLLQARMDQLETEAIALAFEVVCRILGDDASRAEVVGSMVSHAFAQLRSPPVRVRLHPADLALLDEDHGLRQRHPQVQWLADTSVTGGGCLVDSTAGTLDARLDLQLQRLLQCWRDRASNNDGAAR
jgi:flagellar assembly protein FliH